MSVYLAVAGDDAPLSRVGGKAAALISLVAKGFNVPPFVVLTEEAFDGGGLRADAAQELDKALAALGLGPFAVRSSAREEDGASASHAGQFLTVLDVARADVAEAAQKVFKSGAAPSVAAYRQSQGLAADGGAPAVIVQQMVRARAAGVAFTADPVTGDRTRIVVSATEGLGDRLVSGEVDGEDFALDKATGAVLSKPEKSLLSSTDLAALHDLALAVESTFERPQDIEWAFEGETLFLLQARPITTLAPEPTPDEAPGVFDNSNIVESYPGLVSPLTYSFATLVYARVYRMFVKLAGVPETTIAANWAVFENMLARVDGRVYYNLVNWHRALALLPGFSINSAFMETMMGVDEPLPKDVVARLAPKPAAGLARLAEYARVAKVGARLMWHALTLRSTIKDFQRRLDAALSRPAAELARMPLTALATEYRRIEAALLDRWDAPLVNDFLCMIAFGASRKLLERWAGERGLAAHNAIMIGQGDIVSAEPARRIRKMGALAASDAALVAALQQGDRAALVRSPELAREVEAYLEKFGDRCTEELKLESATLDEDPKPLLASIAAAAQTPAKAARPERAVDELAVLFKDAPFRRLLARPLVSWAKARVRDRENLRFERTRIFGRARKLFMGLGREFAALGLLREARDVLCLTVPEVLGAIEGFVLDADLGALVALRKSEQEASAARPDPPTRIVFKGAAILQSAHPLPPCGGGLGRGVAPNAASSARRDPSPRPSPTRGEGEERRGTPCSAGSVTARARVIRDPRVESLAPGEILVARSTDPGWIAVFVNASAIVVERGSLLSHSAIVARELGIPCVVGLKGACGWVATGDVLHVDGESGVVKKLDG